MSIKDPNSKLTRWRLRLAEYNYDVQYKKGKANTNANALSRVQILHNNEVIPQPSTSDDYTALELSNITLPNTPLSNTDLQAILGPPITPETTTQPPTQNESTIDRMPEIDDAIDRQLKQFHIRKTPGNQYRFEDRSKGKTMIKDVWIPINDTKQQIIQFLKEHTIPDRTFHCYFHHEEFYPLFCEVFKTTFSNRGPKLIKCNTRVTLIENISEQTDLIRKYHEGKTIHRGIQ
ncbi:uncharacterized protein LOC114248310 [Bombyx mandarina]|uniref:Uncharacterized protein LOC114248310 n=1 Tax=Bombyx mandarina TaxID=7092 RepID=A0A6J2KAH0_BOMMA|nr:uncharacterized protein LOC114248310 [Bombyx mandarina]